MKEYKAYIFDMDLTLLNTLESSRKSYEYAFKEIGLVFDSDTLVNNLAISLRETYEKLENQTKDVEAFIDAFKLEANKTLKLDSFFYYDGIELIKNLHQKGKMLGIVTNREMRNVLEMLDNEKDIKPLINSIVTCDKVSKLKPSPEPIIKCLEEMNIKKEEACYIGDALNDYKASVAAGIDFICIERYNNCNFDCPIVIHNLMDIIK